MATLLAVAPVCAHVGETNHVHSPSTNAMPHRVERRGPVAAPARMTLPADVAVSGQGFWTFVAATNLMPVPAEARPFVTNAHGTLIVDAGRDIVYWGLQNVGWIGFSNGLRDSWIVQGDPAFTRGNLHGADLLPRRGLRPLIAAADNVEGEVLVSDTTFQNPLVLGVPDVGPYTTNKSYRPTDAAFVSGNRIYITDGYARRFLIPATLEPLAHEGKFLDRNLSKTPHGITYEAKSDSLLVSARPEGQLIRWSVKAEAARTIDGLPTGTLLCDVDLWGDYALAACLEGPGKSPGPLMILNLKKRTLASIIKPKDELGYDFAQHIHDAAWYVRRSGRTTEVYLLFTAWNPGGVGALRLVNPAH